MSDIPDEVCSKFASACCARNGADIAACVVGSLKLVIVDAVEGASSERLPIP